MEGIAHTALLRRMWTPTAKKKILRCIKGGCWSVTSNMQQCVRFLWLQHIELHSKTHSRKTSLPQHHGICLNHNLTKFWRRLSSTPDQLANTVRWRHNSQHFVESENEYFHSYLKSHLEYQPYFLSSMFQRKGSVLPRESVAELLQEVKRKKKLDNLLLLLDHWSGALHSEGSSVLSDVAFGQTVNLLARYIEHFSLEDILEFIVSLSNFDFRNTAFSSEARKHRILVSKSFDQACGLHVKQMKVRDLFLAADFFFSLRGSSFVAFPFLMCKRLKSILASLTKQEQVLVLFHISMARRTPPSMIPAVLDHLKPHLPLLSLQELGIVNLAHYKTQSLINHPEFFTALTSHLGHDANQEVDPICLSAVLKYQHRSLNKCKDRMMPQFFAAVRDMEDSLLRRVSTLPSDTLVHVLNLYYSLDLLSEDLFMAVVERILHRGVQEWRIKDLAKVSHILTNVPVGSDSKMEALAAILMELETSGRQKERRDQPAWLLHTAVALTQCCVYPHWLLQEVFGDKSQRYFNDSRIDYRQELHHLCESVSIEDNTYQGPLLCTDRFPRKPKKKVYTKLIQIHGDSQKNDGVRTFVEGSLSVEKLFSRDIILLEVMGTLQQLCPDAGLLPAFLLPHFHTADVDLQHGSKGTSISKMKGVQRDRVREAVVLHANNAYQTVRLRDGEAVLLLRQYHAMRARQLRKLGAVVVEVPYFEFETSSDKLQYLQNKVRQEQEKCRNQSDTNFLSS